MKSGSLKKDLEQVRQEPNDETEGMLGKAQVMKNNMSKKFKLTSV